jgi:S-formylglutathione hydrolase
MSLETKSAQCCFGGTLGIYAHRARETKTDMKFAVFTPPGQGPFPVLYYLAGLTCTEETFMVKAGAQRLAAERGIMLVAPDTSPRGANIPGESDSWDFGVGAGFYIDATAEPWAANYRMFSYVTDELPAIIDANFPTQQGNRSIFGHSMGGHGALTIALKQPEKWRSVSAFAPISNPVAVPWGEKAFGNYLGPDRKAWAQHDASMLMAKRAFPGPVLVDQGMDDQFLVKQLHPEALEAAAKTSGQDLVLRRHEKYDHSYWFIQTFIADHLAHHARFLK